MPMRTTGTFDFRIDARPMGLRPGIDLHDVHGLLDLLDGDARRSLVARARVGQAPTLGGDKPLPYVAGPRTLSPT